MFQFFLRLGPFISNLFFHGVPIFEGKKMTRHEWREEKKKFCEWASIRAAAEGHLPIHSEIAPTEPVPEQRHPSLSKIGAEDGAAVPKEIS